MIRKGIVLKCFQQLALGVFQVTLNLKLKYEIIYDAYLFVPRIIMKLLYRFFLFHFPPDPHFRYCLCRQ